MQKTRTRYKKNKEKAKSAVIIKHANVWAILKKLNPSCKVFLTTFPGGTTHSMDDYVKPSIRTQPDHFILDVGMNDLISNTQPNETPRKVVDIAEKLKSEKCDAIISEIILRTDKPDLNKKGNEVSTLKRDL